MKRNVNICLLLLILITMMTRLHHQLYAQASNPILYATALCGVSGDQVTIRGGGFTPDGLLTITWSGMRLGTVPRQVQVDPLGHIVFDIVVSYGDPGRYRLSVSDSINEASLTFALDGVCTTPPTPTPITLTPTPTPTATATPPIPDATKSQIICIPNDVIPGQTITVSGQVFQPGATLKAVRWDGVAMVWQPNGVVVNDQGQFNIQLTAPSDDYTLHTLLVEDEASQQATCYLDLIPRNPTLTRTATPTITPSPTATWTPGPPAGMVILPTTTLIPNDHCAQIKAAFTRHPLEKNQITAGITLTNTQRAWLSSQMEIGLWGYQFGAETDTGVRTTLPPLAQGQQTTLPLQFTAPVAGDSWFQVRLIDRQTGQVSPCTSDWQPRLIYDSEPHPPAIQYPLNNTWHNDHDLTLDWDPATIPIRGDGVTAYEVALFDLAGRMLLQQHLPASQTALTVRLGADYGDRQLAWRVRAKNQAGWGKWTTATYFGLDSISPEVSMTLEGDLGDNGWYRSPLQVRIGGDDPVPGSDLTATYLQVAEADWHQTIPGQNKTISREGSYSLRAYGRDGVLNRSPVIVEPVKVDWTPPETVRLIYSAQPTASGWYTQPVTLGLTARDTVSGIKTKHLQLNEQSTVTDTLNLDSEDHHQIAYWARDVAGNETEQKQVTTSLDLTPPTGHLALNGTLCQTCEPADLTITVSDQRSGIAHWTLSLSQTILAAGSSLSHTMTLDGPSIPVGPSSLTLTVEDQAGWIGQSTLDINNAPYIAGPTPTPWQMATATLASLTTATPYTPTYATVTPTATPQTIENDGDATTPSDGTAVSTSTPIPSAPIVPVPNYPVGDTTVPVILPVTGRCCCCR